LDFIPREISDHARHSALQIRGSDRKPAIIIHGVSRRSGTNYLGELLHLHPQISYYPNRIWEFPFLGLSADITRLQERFFLDYETNRGLIGKDDFLPIFGASLLAYLFAYIPPGQRMLLKMPSVRFLHDFFHLFPEENLIVNVRDVAASMIKTWQQIPFPVACRIWDLGARTVLNFNKRFLPSERYMFFKYEDVFRDPSSYVRQVCQKFNLDEQVYPYQDLSNIPILGSSATAEQGYKWSKNSQDFNPIGRWKKWSAYKKVVFKLFSGSSLIDLDYENDKKW
jgi:hypothetical protein